VLAGTGNQQLKDFDGNLGLERRRKRQKNAKVLDDDYS